MNKQTRYDNKRPKITWRVPVGQKEAVEAVVSQLGVNKQEFVDRMFEIAFPILQEEAGIEIEGRPTDIIQDLTDALQLVTDQLRAVGNPEMAYDGRIIARAQATIDLAKAHVR